MRRPQFSLKTILWLTLVVGVFCAVGKAAERLYVRHMIAATRAELAECREKLNGDLGGCGLAWASFKLQEEELENRLAALGARTASQPEDCMTIPHRTPMVIVDEDEALLGIPSTHD